MSPESVILGRKAGKGWPKHDSRAKHHPMQRRSVIFTGRVQGVGFRYTTRGVAEAFAVTGWVRNEPDKTVRLEVQGEPAEVAAMIEALQQRMAGNIRETRVETMALTPGEEGFGIRL